MSDRIDHVAEAARVMEAGRRAAVEAAAWAKHGSPERADGYGKKAHGCWMQAQAHATLALVEQQRIANRLMLAALVSDVELRVGQHGARVGLLGPEGVFHNPATLDGRAPLDDDIREGLGL
jgi:hypothetical protein